MKAEPTKLPGSQYATLESHKPVRSSEKLGDALLGELANNSKPIVPQENVTYILTLPVGVFCVVNDSVMEDKSNEALDVVSISSLPWPQQHVEFLSFHGKGVLKSGGDVALIRVNCAPAKFLISFSLPEGTKGKYPKIVIQKISHQSGKDEESYSVNSPTISVQERFQILAHIQTRGDVVGMFGSRVGEHGSGRWIEGFSIRVPEGLNSSDISYQAILGHDWLSPWANGLEYCGSRGIGVPLMGFRIKLSAQANEKFVLFYCGFFMDGTVNGPVGNDDICTSNMRIPLEAIEIYLIARCS